MIRPGTGREPTISGLPSKTGSMVFFRSRGQETTRFSETRIMARLSLISEQPEALRTSVTLSSTAPTNPTPWVIKPVVLIFCNSTVVGVSPSTTVSQLTRPSQQTFCLGTAPRERFVSQTTAVRPSSDWPVMWTMAWAHLLRGRLRFVSRATARTSLPVRFPIRETPVASTWRFAARLSQSLDQPTELIASTSEMTAVSPTKPEQSPIRVDTTFRLAPSLLIPPKPSATWNSGGTTPAVEEMPP